MRRICVQDRFAGNAFKLILESDSATTDCRLSIVFNSRACDVLFLSWEDSAGTACRIGKA
ncbi:MAG TPA: hypothetical protein DHT43_10850, partial [Deltaproteobacteria bacterium]|nr:hypothetical protein [Deltaproteobacteria bacterium]